jgi:hypothetical protein
MVEKMVLKKVGLKVGLKSYQMIQQTKAGSLLPQLIQH